MSLRCAWCSRPMGYVHGHAACLLSRCPMYGVNQAECCTGEVCVPATSSVSRAPVARPPGARARDDSAPHPVPADPGL